MLMRLFIAVPVPEELKDNIVEIQKKFKEANGDIKAVEKENLHFTLKFIGETDRLKEIEAAMEKALKDFPQFDADIAGISAFPDRNYARVIWLCIKDVMEQMKKLMEVIDAGLSEIGFEQEKEHIPHITLARVRSGRNKAELIRLLEKLEQTQIGRMRVKEVMLVKSVLSKAGPVYENVYGVKLK